MAEVFPITEAIAGISVELWKLPDATVIFRIVEIATVIQMHLKSVDSRRPTMSEGSAKSDEPLLQEMTHNRNLGRYTKTVHLGQSVRQKERIL